MVYYPTPSTLFAHNILLLTMSSIDKKTKKPFALKRLNDYTIYHADSIQSRIRYNTIRYEMLF